MGTGSDPFSLRLGGGRQDSAPELVSKVASSPDGGVLASARSTWLPLAPPGWADPDQHFGRPADIKSQLWPLSASQARAGPWRIASTYPAPAVCHARFYPTIVQVRAAVIIVLVYR